MIWFEHRIDRIKNFVKYNFFWTKAANIFQTITMNSIDIYNAMMTQQKSRDQNSNYFQPQKGKWFDISKIKPSNSVWWNIPMKFLGQFQIAWILSKEAVMCHESCRCVFWAILIYLVTILDGISLKIMKLTSIASRSIFILLESFLEWKNT